MNQFPPTLNYFFLKNRHLGVSAYVADPVHDDQQGGGTRSSAESTDCGTVGDGDLSDRDDDDDEAKKEEDKKRQREIKRIVSQRRREVRERNEAQRVMVAAVAKLQLEAQLVPPQDALPQHDSIPLPSTTTDWGRAAEGVAKWVQIPEDVQILQERLDTEMKYGQSRRINSARLLKVKESFRRNGLLRLTYCRGRRDERYVRCRSWNAHGTRVLCP